MKKIKSVDEIPNLDKRILCPIQMLPMDFGKVIPLEWDRDTTSESEFPGEILSFLIKEFSFANLKGFLHEGSYWVYDWPWQGKTFEQRYQRLEDKTGAFLRTCGAVVLLNAEHIRLTDLASRRDCEALVWDMIPDSEPYLLRS